MKDRLRDPWVQATVSLLLACAAGIGAALIPGAAGVLNVAAGTFMGFAAGRPLRAGNDPGRSDQNPEIPPPAGDR